MLEATIELGHSYLGCEHLLLGLARQDTGAAATVLRDHGVDAALVLRAVKGAVAGFAHANATGLTQGSIATDRALADLTRRIEDLEQRLP